MVTPLYEREDGSAAGPFYVIKDRCVTCSLPIQTAPENIQYHERPCTSCPTSLTAHCVVTRQPETPEEVGRMIEVVRGSEVEAYRYCGTDPEILRRLAEAGCRAHCDALVVRRQVKSRMAFLGIAALLAGLFWSLGSNLHAVVTHFFAPPAYAVAVGLLFPSASLRQQALLLASVLAVAQIVRLLAYSAVADGWQYLTSDGETRLALLISFALQCLIALLVWGGVIFVKRSKRARS